MNKVISSKTLGENIKKMRQERNLTQEEAVARLQLLGSPISRSTYSLIEMGRGNVFASDLVAMQLVFKTDFAAFFEGIGPTRPARR